MTQRKKLIEVALPLEAINKEASREKSIRHGHPSTLHLWWARRPLAAARAVIFAQMVDDPSSWPELFPTEEEQKKERQRLFQLIEQLVKWENTTNEEILQQARDEIWKSWRRTCSDWRQKLEKEREQLGEEEYQRLMKLFDPDKLPAFHDPFAGGGSLPLEAQRLGLEAYASDLNPVAVLINKAMIEIPPRFANQPPVNPEARQFNAHEMKTWRGAQGLAEDVRYYGKWMRDEAEKRIGHLYPKVKITEEMVRERPDLKPYLGRELTVIAWIWARTVRSPNPAFADVHVPLASTFMLSTKKGKEAYVEPVIEGRNYRFTVKVGKPPDPEAAKKGTKLGRGANFRCLLSNTPISGDYIKAEGRSGRMGTRLMAIVVEGDRGRIYLSPLQEHEEIARQAKPEWKPENELVGKCRDQLPLYGMNTFADIFTPRQLVSLTTFSDLVQEAIQQVERDAIAAGLPDDGVPLREGGRGARAYAEAVGVYLGIAVSRTANTVNAFAVWSKSREQSVNLFSRQAIPMTWDYPDVNPFGKAAGDFSITTASISKIISHASDNQAFVKQMDARVQNISKSKVVCTDPPYYDNISYADLSDFFYIWQRASLKNVFPELFSTLAVPKGEELVATLYRHNSKEAAERFFLIGMTDAFKNIGHQAHPAFPVTIYYAFKQSENNGNGDVASTGWETFLDAVIRASFTINGTWPMRTERPTGVKKITNALASSIVLVCRRRPKDAPVGTRREFLQALKTELPKALRLLQQGNIAPVDLQQAAIGPGMAVFTRYSKVLDAAGNSLRVRDALALINQVLDEVLAEQEGEFDADTRWAIAWYEQFGFAEGDFGVAETLSKAKNTSVEGMVEAGILHAQRGKVRLLRPEELPEDWDPATDERLTVWEAVHHLIRRLENGGERHAADLLAKMGTWGEATRELAYRLFIISERKQRAREALAYNALVQSWPEIEKLARLRQASNKNVQMKLEWEN